MPHPGLFHHMTMELQADRLRATDPDRLVRQQREPRRLRRCVGQLLITAGEALVRQPVDTVGVIYQPLRVVASPAMGRENGKGATE